LQGIPGGFGVLPRPARSGSGPASASRPSLVNVRRFLMSSFPPNIYYSNTFTLGSAHRRRKMWGSEGRVCGAPGLGTISSYLNYSFEILTSWFNCPGVSFLHIARLAVKLQRISINILETFEANPNLLFLFRNWVTKKLSKHSKTHWHRSKSTKSTNSFIVGCYIREIDCSAYTENKGNWL
jgi:hypothetical protein